MAWVLAWEDNFAVDGPPDLSKWIYEVNHETYDNKMSHDDSDHYFKTRFTGWAVDSPANVRVESGCLILEVRSSGDHGVTTARLRSAGGYSDVPADPWVVKKQVGPPVGGIRYEARMKIEKCNGTWPAFWTSGVGPDLWSESGEIDILEAYGENLPEFTGTIWAKSVTNQTFSYNPGGDLGADFHTYAIEWFQSHVAWYFDATLVNSVPNTALSPWPYNTYPQDVRLWHDWIDAGGGLDPGGLPKRLWVDYVRIYNWQSASGELEWTAEVDGPDVRSLTITHLQITDQLVAGQIAAGAIGASEIAAAVVAAKHLVVGDYTNAVPNPMFQGGGTDHWTLSPGVSVTSRGGAGVPAGAPTEWVGMMVASGGSYAACPVGNLQEWIDCTPGESYFISMEAASDSSVNSIFSVGVQWATGSGVFLSNEFAGVGSGASSPWGKVGGILTVPSSARRFVFLAQAWGTAGKWFFAQPRIRKAGDGELIVDGSLLARHVGANEIIGETANLKDAVVSTLKIGANQVTVPVGAYDTAGHNVPCINWNARSINPNSCATIASAVIATHGYPVMINAAANWNSDDTNADIIFLLSVNSATAALCDIFYTGAGPAIRMPMAFGFVHTPSSGTNFYKLSAYMYSATSKFAAADRGSLLLLECQR